MEVFDIANNRENPINEKIRCREMMVIGPNGEQLGVKSKQDALTLASYASLDLVLISPNANPPVCKVMDYNKFRYEKQKKEKEALKKQKANMSELKEFRLSPVIDVGDFETKLRNATKYLEKGDRIKLSIRFKGRQMAHTELGKEVLERFASRVTDYADIEQKPKLEGKNMILLDLGAEVGKYHADITRTYPIKGKYGELERKIYQSVLDCNKHIISIIKPGLTIMDLQKETISFFDEKF